MVSMEYIYIYMLILVSSVENFVKFHFYPHLLMTSIIKNAIIDVEMI